MTTLWSEFHRNRQRKVDSRAVAQLCPKIKYNYQWADFHKTQVSRQPFAKHCCAKFHENPTNDLVSHTRSQSEERISRSHSHLPPPPQPRSSTYKVKYGFEQALNNIEPMCVTGLVRVWLHATRKQQFAGAVSDYFDVGSNMFIFGGPWMHLTCNGTVPTSKEYSTRKWRRVVW